MFIFNLLDQLALTHLAPEATEARDSEHPNSVSDDRRTTRDMIESLFACVACIDTDIEIGYDPADNIIIATVGPRPCDDLTCSDDREGSSHPSIPLDGVFENGLDWLLWEVYCNLNLSETVVRFTLIFDRRVSQELLDFTGILQDVAERCEDQLLQIEALEMIAVLDYFRKPITEAIKAGDVFSIEWTMKVATLDADDDAAQSSTLE